MNDQTIKPSRQKKEALVAEFKDKISRAKSVVFTNYTGMTHKQIEELKQTIKATDAEFLVTKNTLLLRALSGGQWKIENKDEIKGPTAAIFSFSDIIAPLKALAKTIKTLNLPVIKFAILESRKITSEEVIKLSAIPPKEVLLAQIVGGLKAPIFGLHRALNWNIQKLVLTLNAVKNTKRA